MLPTTSKASQMSWALATHKFYLCVCDYIRGIEWGTGREIGKRYMWKPKVHWVPDWLGSLSIHVRICLSLPHKI